MGSGLNANRLLVGKQVARSVPVSGTPFAMCPGQTDGKVLRRQDFDTMGLSI